MGPFWLILMSWTNITNIAHELRTPCILTGSTNGTDRGVKNIVTWLLQLPTATINSAACLAATLLIITVSGEMSTNCHPTAAAAFYLAHCPPPPSLWCKLLGSFNSFINAFSNLCMFIRNPLHLWKYVYDWSCSQYLLTIAYQFKNI